MNIFEGSRRIAKITAGLWITGFAIAAFNVSDTAYVTYLVPTFNAAPVLSSDDSCPNDSYKDYSIQNTKTPSGTDVNITLCFEATDGFDEGRRLVPYKIATDSKLIWGSDKYSNEVRDYAKKYISNFRVNVADYERIDRKGNSRWWSQVKEGATIMIFGLVFLFALVHAVGWIVRGFMGIPKGQDSKPKI
ncbi:hypothetical protein [Limnohabitans sp. T6-20]|uniref:hypothetical protein n=1 Tax=Limnohabitans sp. T6-20 TaxID=1100725 RepID=UPI000D35444A|nr:hypothetical protein [Limnohabitans sp. T6-20]PUE12246.1 hypothetical protein B9Z33_01435 [Limnohabitans sp. T6-20]